MSFLNSRSDSQRPVPLYFYGERTEIERARQFGEFCLRPNVVVDALSRVPPASAILPFGVQKKIPSAEFLTLSLSTTWSEKFFRASHDVTHCLVINDTEEFGERLHRAVQKVLPQWAGIDATVAYGKPSPLGAAFTKGADLAAQKEWLFAWRPIHLALSLQLQPIVVQVGCIESLSELRVSARARI